MEHIVRPSGVHLAGLSAGWTGRDGRSNDFGVQMAENPAAAIKMGHIVVADVSLVSSWTVLEPLCLPPNLNRH